MNGCNFGVRCSYVYTKKKNNCPNTPANSKFKMTLDVLVSQSCDYKINDLYIVNAIKRMKKETLASYVS